MRSPAILAAVLALAAGCAAASGGIDSQEQLAQPLDRLLIGEAARYPADTSLRARTGELEASMAERRKMAWSIVEKVLAPVRISGTAADGGEPLSMPRFQTWYSNEDFFPMFDRLFRAMSPADQKARRPFTDGELAAIFPWNATMGTSLASFTQERLEARRRDLQTAAGLASLGKDPRVLMSPGYVEHVLRSYETAQHCDPTIEDPNIFAPCLSGEFPVDAVAIKSRWMPDTMNVPVYDTSANALRTRLENGTFGPGDRTASPTADQAYTMQLTPTTKSRLVALHVMTKELQDWAWITLWWSPDPDTDFGADRPASISGAFRNYKMCVVTAYEEKDPTPGAGFPASLADAIDATHDGPATWCSNPYLESAEHAAKTSCIGCHQAGGTGETTFSILDQTEKFPDHARTKVRVSFPSDYAFTLNGGLDLAAGMQSRMDAVTPR